MKTFTAPIGRLLRFAKMSDRKYRQRGYQDEGPRERRPQGAQGPKKPIEPRDPRMPRDPRVPNMPGFREVFRCTRCGSIEPIAIGPESTCNKCGTDLHACVQCSSFDAGSSSNRTNMPGLDPIEKASWRERRCADEEG